jgi:hypothetical protein
VTIKHVSWHEEEHRPNGGKFHWEGFFFLHDKQVKMTVYRDGYDVQSYARSDVWLGDHGWTLVHQLLEPDIWNASYVGSLDKLRTCATNDTQELLRITEEILGIVERKSYMVPAMADLSPAERLAHLDQVHGFVRPTEADLRLHPDDHGRNLDIQHEHRRRRSP